MISQQIRDLRDRFDSGQISPDAISDAITNHGKSLAGMALDELRFSCDQRDVVNLEYSYTLASLAGPDREIGKTMCELLLEDWHGFQEWIVDYLETNKFVEAADALYQASLKTYRSREYDDYHALQRRCMYALVSLGTADAEEKLRLLATHQDDEVAAIAKHLLGT